MPVLARWAGGRSPQGVSAASPGAGTGQSMPPGLVPGEGTSAESWGGDGDPEAQRPYPEPRSQPEGLAAPAPAVLSLQEGVHLSPEQQCTAPLGSTAMRVPARAGPGAGTRGMQARGRASATGTRERRMREEASYKGGDETHPEGAQAAREKQAEAAENRHEKGRRRQKRGRARWREGPGEKELEAEDR